MQVVIALYRESHRWIRRIPDHYDVVVYSKCNHFPRSLKNAKSIALPNIGRESHTYLHHICQNYHQLHDRTVFLQGWPFDHSHNILEILSKGFEEEYVTIGDVQFKHDFLRMKLNHVMHHVNKGHFLMLKQISELVPLVWNEFYKTSFPNIFHMNIGHQFAITSDLIRAFPLSTYQRILEMHKHCDQMPYVCEKVFPQVYLKMMDQPR